MSYISRQAAIDLCDWYDNPSMHDDLEKLPSAEPEIIRCKDCKYYEIWQLKTDYTDDKRCKPSVCVLGRYAVHRSEDWFCADAERRTE